MKPNLFAALKGNKKQILRKNKLGPDSKPDPETKIKSIEEFLKSRRQRRIAKKKAKNQAKKTNKRSKQTKSKS